MRALIIQRITELRFDTRFNAHWLFAKGKKYHGWSLNTFTALSDEDLVKHFENIIMNSYRQM